MANIRIKDLTTTASVPAADDFLELDGATNGSRKLSWGTLGNMFNLRPPRPGVYFDGTTNQRILAQLTGQQIGTDHYSFVVGIGVPSSNPSTQTSVFALGPSATDFLSSGGNTVMVSIGTNGALQIDQAAGSGNYQRWNYSTFVAEFGGRDVNLAVVRSGVTPVLYINGVSYAVTAGISGGSVPTFAATVDSTYLALGYAASASTSTIGPLAVRFATLYNLALSQTDAEEIYFRGGAVPYRYQWATQNAYTSDFSVNEDGVTPATSSPTITGNIDGIGGQDNNLRVVATAAAMPAIARTPNTAYGRWQTVRIKGSVYAPSANTTLVDRLYVRLSGSTGVLSTGFAAVTEDAWSAFSLDVTNNGTANNSIQIRPASGSDVSNGTAGDTIYFRGIVVQNLGAVVHLPMDEGIGYQLHDASTNKLDAVMTTTGVAHLIARDRGYVRGTLTWAGTHEAKDLLGQQAIPSGAVTTLATLTMSAATSGSGATVGTTNSATRVAAASTFTLGQKKVLTLANQMPAGTAAGDLNRVIDPDTANYTGTASYEEHYTVTLGTP